MVLYSSNSNKRESKYMKTERKAKQFGRKFGRKLAWSSCLFLYFKIHCVKVSTFSDFYPCVQNIAPTAPYKKHPLIASRPVPILFYFFNWKRPQIKQLFLFYIILQLFVPLHSQELHHNNPIFFSVTDTVQISVSSIFKLNAYQRVTSTLINTKSAWFIIFYQLSLRGLSGCWYNSWQG